MESSFIIYLFGAAIVFFLIRQVLRPKQDERSSQSSNVGGAGESPVSEQSHPSERSSTQRRIQPPSNPTAVLLRDAILSKKPLELLLPNRLQAIGALRLRDFVSPEQRGEILLDGENQLTPQGMFFENRGYQHIIWIEAPDGSLSVDFFDTFLTVTGNQEAGGGGIYVLAPVGRGGAGPLESLDAEAAMMDLIRLSRSSEGKAAILGDADCVLRSFRR